MVWKGRDTYWQMTALALASIIHPRSHLPNEKLYLSSVGEWIRSPLTSTAMTMTPMTRDIGCSVGSVSSPGMTTPLIHVDGSYVCVVGINFSNHVVIIWHRGKAKIDRLLGNAPPETCTAPEPTCRFPSEIVDMIIVHLTKNLDTLKACSLAFRP